MGDPWTGGPVSAGGKAMVDPGRPTAAERKLMNKKERRTSQNYQRHLKAGGSPWDPVADPLPDPSAPPGDSGGGGGGDSSSASASASIAVPPSTPSSMTSSGGADLMGTSAGGRSVKKVAPLLQHDDERRVRKADKRRVFQTERVQKEVQMFQHLPQYEHESVLFADVGLSKGRDIHPAVVQLGLKYADGSVRGSTARCAAMLTAFMELIRDFRPPDGSVYAVQELQSVLNRHTQFLVDCRPLAVSMGNAINFIKTELGHTGGFNLEEARAYMVEKIESFLHERIILADEVIAGLGAEKIVDDDVVLTYASSHVVEMVLQRARAQGRRFRVIIADTRTTRDGRELMKRLLNSGIPCTYLLINGLSYVMREVTKVIVGAYAMLANGYGVSRCGVAAVCLMAHEKHVPVLFCCETYKFSKRAQLDSVCFNELGNPEDLISDDVPNKEVLADWRDNEGLFLLNLIYDVTPAQLIDMVVTEVGLLPPSSVSVVLRELGVTNAQA